MFSKLIGPLLALSVGLLGGCRSEKAAFHFRPPAGAAHLDTALVCRSPRPASSPQAPARTRPAVILQKPLARVSPPRRRERQRRRVAPAAAPRVSIARRRAPVRRPTEVQYLDPAQRNAVTTIIAGAILTALGLLLVALLVNGGGGSLGAALLVILITYGGLIALGIGLVLLLVTTLLKLLHRN